MPVPVTVITAGEFVALLAILMLPEIAPEVVGANCTDAAAVCPGFKTVAFEIPVTLMPAPETETPDKVTLEFPVLVNVTLCEAGIPTATFPKFKDVLLTDSN